MHANLWIIRFFYLTPIGCTWTRISTRCFLCAQRTLGVRVVSSSLIAFTVCRKGTFGDLFLTVLQNMYNASGWVWFHHYNSIRLVSCPDPTGPSMHELGTLCNKWVGLISLLRAKGNGRVSVSVHTWAEVCGESRGSGELWQKWLHLGQVRKEKWSKYYTHANHWPWHAHTTPLTHSHSQKSPAARGIGSPEGAAGEGWRTSEALLCSFRRARSTKSNVSVESPWQRYHWDGGEMWESGWDNGTAAGRRGLPLPH